MIKHNNMINKMNNINNKKGFTLIEVIVMLGMLSLVIISTFNILTYSLKLSKDKSKQEDALVIANEEMEYLRSIPYNTLGTPLTNCQPAACSLDTLKTTTRNSTIYTITTSIIYMDDAFDNAVVACNPESCVNSPYTVCNSNICEDASGNPDPEGSDSTGLNDYKKARIEVQWPNNTGPAIILTSTFAPGGAEPNCVGGRGVLKINVIDDNAQPVANAGVYIDNANIVGFTPTDTQTDSLGILRIGCLDEDTDNNYSVTANKPGTINYVNTYSTDQTCPIGTGTPDPICPTLSPSNNNPYSIHPNIINDTTTYKTFTIDLLSTLQIKTITQTLPSEWTINTTQGNGKIQDMASSATGPADSYYFFWRDDSPGPTKIFGQKYNSTQTALWGGGTNIQISTSNNQVLPNVTINQTTGDAFLAWNDNSNGNQDIYLEKLASATGTSLWGGSNKLTVAVPSQNQDQSNPKINIEDSDNFFYLTFLDNTNDTADIYTSRKNSADNTYLYCTEDNSPCLTETSVCGPTSAGICSQWTQQELKINDDSGAFVQESISTTVEPISDDLYAVWTDDRGGDKDIYAQKVNPSGTFDAVWNSNIKINEASAVEQSYPSIAITDETGIKYLYVVWQDFRNNTDFDIFMTKLDTNGTKIWTNDIELTATEITNADQTKPSIAINASNEIFVAWEDKRNSTISPDIYLQKYNTSGSPQWTNDMMVNYDTTENTEQLSPQLMINNLGQVIVTWEDDDAGDFDIRAAIVAEPNPTNEPSVDLRLHGSKIIGFDTSVQNIYKLDNIYTTDASGEINFTGANKIEWDDYYISTSGMGYTILRADPPMNPTFNMIPNSDNTILLTVATVPAQSGDFVIDIGGAILSNGNKNISGIMLRNTGSTDVVVDKITVNWSDSKEMENIDIGTSTVWDDNVDDSGTLLDVANATFNPSDEYPLNIHFEDSLVGTIFSLTFTLSDGSQKSSPNFGPL